MTDKYDQYPLVQKAFNAASAPSYGYTDDLRSSLQGQALSVNRALDIVDAYMNIAPTEKEAVMTAIVLMKRGLFCGEQQDLALLETEYSPEVRRIFESGAAAFKAASSVFSSNATRRQYVSAAQTQSAICLAAIQSHTESLRKGVLPQQFSDLDEAADNINLLALSVQLFLPMIKATAPRFEQAFKETMQDCSNVVDNFQPATVKKPEAPKP